MSTQTDDELRPEYDLRDLSVRRFVPGRKSFGGCVVRLDSDVAAVFPDAGAVNEALRFLIRIKNKPLLRKAKGDA